MKALVDAGYKLVIVTSQSGIAKGQYNENSFLGVMLMAEMAMADILGADGYWPTLVCACYHQESDQCECRKPKTLHWYQKIVPYFGPISLDDSWMVGDRFTDVAFGRKIGLSTAKIPDQYTSLHDFAETLLSREIPDHG